MPIFGPSSSVKSPTVVRANVTMTASAGNATSSSVNLTDSRGAVCDIKLTNGATGPTIPAQVQVEVSEDDSNYYAFGGPLKGNTDNNGIESWGGIAIPASARHVRFVSGSNTGQDVTMRIGVSEIT